jgi:hypothetical protein
MNSMSAGMKKLVSVLLLLFAVGTTIVLADVSESQYNLAKQSGYDAGYRDNVTGKYPRSGRHYKASAGARAEYPGKETNPDISKLRGAYTAGYSLGWDDAKAKAKD